MQEMKPMRVVFLGHKNKTACVCLVCIFHLFLSFALIYFIFILKCNASEKEKHNRTRGNVCVRKEKTEEMK